MGTIPQKGGFPQKEFTASMQGNHESYCECLLSLVVMLQAQMSTKSIGVRSESAALRTSSALPSQIPSSLKGSGSETEYQNLAYSGRPIWLEWNDTIAKTPANKLPPGITPDTKLFVPCGLLRVTTKDDHQLSDYDTTCLEALEKAGLRHHMHVLVSLAPVTRCVGVTAEHERRIRRT